MITASVNIQPEMPVRAAVALARHAERLGFERCWVYDQGLAARDVYVTLTAIAAATERLRLGPGITNPFTRHPAATAAAIASLDELSGGRAFLGLGAGGSFSLGPLGLDRRRALTAVTEMIHVCRALFGGDPVDFAGTHVQLVGARLAYGRPDTEIWVAGRGPKMLAMGAALADGVMLDCIHRDLLRGQVQRIRSRARDAGRTPAVSYSTMVVTDDASLASAKAHLTYRLVDSPPEVRELLDIGPDDVARIRAAMQAGGDAASRAIRDDWLDPFVIGGTAEQLAGRLRHLAALGIGGFILPVMQEHGAIESMDALAAALARLDG